MVMLDDDDDHDAAAAPDVAVGVDTCSDSDDTAPAAAVDGCSIASHLRRHGAPRPALPQTIFAFDAQRGALHIRTVPAYAISIDMSDA
eukprot:561718-Pleurochrysis_carterae.AAC.1